MRSIPDRSGPPDGRPLGRAIVRGRPGTLCWRAERQEPCRADPAPPDPRPRSAEGRRQLRQTPAPGQQRGADSSDRPRHQVTREASAVSPDPSPRSPEGCWQLRLNPAPVPVPSTQSDYWVDTQYRGETGLFADSADKMAARYLTIVLLQIQIRPLQLCVHLKYVQWE